MKILILGSDGYIGFPLMLRLLEAGHEVEGIDNFSRRYLVYSIGSNSVTPITSTEDRTSLCMDTREVENILEKFCPDAIIHLAQMPSAPYSMRGSYEARGTYINNVVGNLTLLWAMRKYCPHAHLIKLGTMGEYGTPDCEIPEGIIPDQPCSWTWADDVRQIHPKVIKLKRKCPMSGLLFPRSPGSFYHLTKVHETHDIHFACKTWGLTATDIMQGIVFGLDKTEPASALTRFDYDEYFGTVINRFIAQACIGHPLTVYGSGGQTRGFLPLKDSLQCIELILNNPPEPGTYRTVNQYADTLSISQLAAMVMEEAVVGRYSQLGLRHIPNPRVELEDHNYRTTNQTLIDLGYEPSVDTRSEIAETMEVIYTYRRWIKESVILPKTTWR